MKAALKVLHSLKLIRITPFVRAKALHLEMYKSSQELSKLFERGWQHNTKISLHQSILQPTT